MRLVSMFLTVVLRKEDERSATELDDDFSGAFREALPVRR